MNYSVRDADGNEIAQTVGLYDAVMIAEANCVYKNSEFAVFGVMTDERCVTVTKNNGSMNRIGWNGKPHPTALFCFSS